MYRNSNTPCNGSARTLFTANAAQQSRGSSSSSATHRRRRATTPPPTTTTTSTTLVVRECIAVGLRRILEQSLVRLTGASSTTSTTLLFALFCVEQAMGGLLPHLATRLCERRLDRKETLPTWSTLLLYTMVPYTMQLFSQWRAGQDIHLPTVVAPMEALEQLQLPSQLSFTRVVPLLSQHGFPFAFQVLQTTLFTMSLLVIPILLQLNGMYRKGYIFMGLLFLLVTFPSAESGTEDADEDNLLYYYYLTVQLTAGWLAGRWMQRYFPDDPTVETLRKHR